VQVHRWISGQVYGFVQSLSNQTLWPTDQTASQDALVFDISVLQGGVEASSAC